MSEERVIGNPDPPQLSAEDLQALGLDAMIRVGPPPVASPGQPAPTRAAGATSAAGAVWHVIHGGVESGPLSEPQLLEMAGAGRIAADDFVKQPDGMWAKARDVGLLKGYFERFDAIERLGRFHGVWLSKKALVICGSVLVVLGGLAFLWQIRHNRLNSEQRRAAERRMEWMLEDQRFEMEEEHRAAERRMQWRLEDQRAEMERRLQEQRFFDRMREQEREWQRPAPLLPPLLPPPGSPIWKPPY